MRENKRDIILQAAYELFLENGYDNAPMAKISKRAGVMVSHSYYFFENKEAVLDAVIRMAQDTYYAKMAQALSECDGFGIEALTEHCFIELDGIRAEAAFVMHSLLTPKLTERVKESMVEHNIKAVQEMLAPVLERLGGRAYSADEIEVAATILLGIINTYFMEGDRERFRRAAIAALKMIAGN